MGFRVLYSLTLGQLAAIVRFALPTRDLTVTPQNWLPGQDLNLCLHDLLDVNDLPLAAPGNCLAHPTRLELVFPSVKGWRPIPIRR